MAVLDRALRPPAGPGAASGQAWSAVLKLLAATALVGGVVVRLWPRSGLWLDEAQSVAIARVPLGEIPELLRVDGAPPLYYLLLHGWMELFGSGDVAVRSLSIVLSLAAMAAVGVVARRWAGPTGMWAALVLYASNPFAVRYATETRMYALVALEVLAGLWLVPRALDRPTPRRLAGVALLATSLLYTHYWTTYLLAATGPVLLGVWWRAGAGPRRAAVLRVGLAVGTGGLLWLPWLPVMLFQAEHTATPWSRSATLLDLVQVVPAFVGGAGPTATALSVLFTTLVIMGAFGAVLIRSWGRAAAAGRAPATPWAISALVVLTPTLALVGGMLTGSAYARRYTSVVMPAVVVLAAIGAARLRPSTRTVVLAAAVLGALPVISAEIGSTRSSASEIAPRLAALAQPGDVVVFCPDQLGPATARILARSTVGRTLQLGTFPDFDTPSRVDWIDYGDRHRQAIPYRFAAEAVARAGDGDVWLVWSDIYPPTQVACGALRSALVALRPAERMLVGDDPRRHLDHGALLRYPRVSTPLEGPS